MFLKIHPDNPNEHSINKVVEILSKGGIIIYPTDTLYAIGCSIFNQKAIERIAQIKGIHPDKTKFSFMCYDLSHLSDYCKQIDNNVYKIMRKYLPGPYTFILKANSKVPKILESKRNTVGIRVPNNNIARVIVHRIGHPIVSTSIKKIDEITEYPTDPEVIYDEYKNIVDAVIDGGVGGVIPSTVIDCSKDEIEVIREGKGKIDL